MDTNTKASTTDAESGLGQYRQRVSVEFDVMISVGRSGTSRTFNDVTTDALREAVERWTTAHVEQWLYAQPTVTALRGPGGSRYFYPGEDQGWTADSKRPFWVSLDDLEVTK